MNQFHTATLKLTGWYFAILMAVCVTFSAVIYQIASHEFDRPLPADSQQRVRLLNSIDVFSEIREQRAEESKQNLFGNLIVLNAITLMIGACASYLFARRTLTPIEQAMEAQARFTSDASHELRTPLAVMRTESEIALRDKKPTVKSLTAVVKSNVEEVERLQKLTDRLLTLSSSQSLTLEEFSLGEAAHSAALRHATAAKQRNIILEVTVDDLTAIGDSQSISDIIAILVDNAIKYSPANTTVTVSSVERGNYLELLVSDEGTGIPEADVEHIFDRFYRADQSRSKDAVEGHGLGLALAKQLAILNNATLTVENTTPHGACFRLRLPKPKHSINP